MRRSWALSCPSVVGLPFFLALLAVRAARLSKFCIFLARYPPTSILTRTRSLLLRLTTFSTRYCMASSVWPLFPMRRPALPPVISYEIRWPSSLVMMLVPAVMPSAIFSNASRPASAAPVKFPDSTDGATSPSKFSSLAGCASSLSICFSFESTRITAFLTPTSPKIPVDPYVTTVKFKYSSFISSCWQARATACSTVLPENSTSDDMYPPSLCEFLLYVILLRDGQHVVDKPVQDEAGRKINENECKDNRHQHHHLGLCGISHGGRHFQIGRASCRERG